MTAPRVWLRHPNLPGQPVEVAPSAVPHLQASGWEPATPPPPRPRLGKKKATPESPEPSKTPASAGVSAFTESDSETPTKRRRSSTPKEES